MVKTTSSEKEDRGRNFCLQRNQFIIRQSAQVLEERHGRGWIKGRKQRVGWLHRSNLPWRNFHLEKQLRMSGVCSLEELAK